MTIDQNFDIHSIESDRLGMLLLAGALDGGWSEQAAVDLLVNTGYWLDRPELRDAIELTESPDGQVSTRILWARIPPELEAPLEALQILELACSLAGYPTRWALSHLLAGISDETLVQALQAIFLAARGPGAVLAAMCDREEDRC